MEVTLYMAVSVDGYIAKTDMSTNWVSEIDFGILDEKIQLHKCVILGNTTFKEFGPTKGVTNIIISSTGGEQMKDIYHVKNVNEAIELCKNMNISNPLLIGGGITNSSFLREAAIDNIILSVHPVILGKGVKLFEDIELEKKLVFITSESHKDGLIHLHYKVNK